MKRPLLAAIVVGVVAAGTAAAQEAQRNVAASVHTAAQAQAGRDLYRASCSICHGEDLKGVGASPPLAGADFLTRWVLLPAARITADHVLHSGQDFVGGFGAPETAATEDQGFDFCGHGNR
jgi:hypothetical protein